jgi:hypothetical protein
MRNYSISFSNWKTINPNLSSRSKKKAKDVKVAIYARSYAGSSKW